VCGIVFVRCMFVWCVVVVCGVGRRVWCVVCGGSVWCVVVSELCGVRLLGVVV
jgi:hypothetical protein